MSNFAAWGLFAAAIAIFAAVYVASFAAAVRAFRGVWYHEPATWLVEPDFVPAMLRDPAGPQAQALASLGFVAVGQVQVIRAAGDVVYHALFRHADPAVVAALSMPGVDGAPTVQIWTRFAGNQAITTMPDHARAWAEGDPDHCVGFAVPAGPTAVDEAGAVFEAHRQAVAAAETAGRRPLEDGLEMMRYRIYRAYADGFDRQVAAGDLVPDLVGFYRLTWAAAFRQTLRVALAQEREALRHWPAAPPAPEPEEVAIARDVAAFRELPPDAAAPDAGGTFKVIVAAIALLALFAFPSVASAAAARGAGATAAMILAVAAFHALGHLVAAAALGHLAAARGWGPFVGDRALRRLYSVARPRDRVVLALAGPMPGLVAGVLITVAAHLAPGVLPAWAADLALYAVAVNLVFLLPVDVLDGGHAVRAILGPDRRWTALAIAGATLLTAGAASYWAGWMAFLLVIVLAFTLRIEESRLVAARRLRAALGPRDAPGAPGEAPDDVTLTALYGILRSGRFRWTSSPDRHAIAADLLGPRPAAPGLARGALAAYLVALTLGAPALAGALALQDAATRAEVAVTTNPALAERIATDLEAAAADGMAPGRDDMMTLLGADEPLAVWFRDLADQRAFLAEIRAEAERVAAAHGGVLDVPDVRDAFDDGDPERPGAGYVVLHMMAWPRFQETESTPDARTQPFAHMRATARRLRAWATIPIEAGAGGVPPWSAESVQLRVMRDGTSTLRASREALVAALRGAAGRRAAPVTGGRPAYMIMLCDASYPYDYEYNFGD